MHDDHSDILGQNTRPVVRVETNEGPVNLSLPYKIALYAILFLVGYVVLISTWEALRKWRERTYKLAMRRRHGIPDDDHRPFHIAYAAVMRARQNNEAAKRLRSRSEQPSHVPEPRRVAPEQDLRHRGGPQRMDVAWGTGVNGIPGRFQTSDPLPASLAQLEYNANLPSVDPYNPILHSARAAPPQNPPPVIVNPTNRFPGNYLVPSAVPEAEMRSNQGAGAETIKASYAGLARGSKRGMGDEDDNDDIESKRAREKRARKVSLERQPTIVESMDVDAEEDDEYPEQSVNARGKKRDRAEAASTFGGDDEDSASEVDEDPNTRRRRRKRQTVTKRKSDAAFASRGKKRDRGVEESESEGSETDIVPRVSRKKRGRKNSSPIEVDGDDKSVSLDDSQSSAGGRRRRVGEEWESNGVRYKIGPNGQRLRQALVKKARQKFAMPQDSQHPDREANLEICIETWMSENEYAEAKSQYLLAWQDTPKGLAEHSASLTEPTSPSAASGKDLLWRSVISRAPSMESAASPVHDRPAISFGKSHSQRDFLHQSVAGNLGLRINPFQKSQSFGNGKRVVSTRVGQASMPPPSPVSIGLTDSTNASPRHRTFSKWEKQDLEAKAMSKMREITEKKEEEKREKERAEKDKVEKDKAEREKATAASLAATKPALALTFNSTAPTTASSAATVAAAAPSFSLPAPPSTVPKSAPTATPASFPAPTTSAPKPADGLKFAFPSVNTATTAPTAATPFPVAPSTSGQPALNNPFGEKKPEIAQAAGGSSLVSRLGPPAASSQGDNKPSTGFQFGPSSQPAAVPQSAPSGLKFNLGVPNRPAATPSTAPTPTQAFNLTAPSQTTTPSTTPAASAAPKFDFGVKAGSPNPFSTAAPAAPEAARQLFGGFGAPNAPAHASMVFNASTASAPDFGPAKTTSSATPSTLPTSAAQPTEAPKSAFTGFSQQPTQQTSGTSSGFSFNTGFGQPKPAENATPAPMTAFATPSITITPASTNPQPTEQPKSAFTFNSQPSPSTTAPTFGGFGSAKPAPSAFGFGSNGPSSTDASKPTTPVFGGAAKVEPIKPSLSFGATTPSTSSFGGFGTTPTTEAPKNPFPFGQAPAAPSNQPAEAPKASFAFNTSAPNNSVFTFGAGPSTAKPNTNGSASPAPGSPFGFNAGPSAGNAFGSAPKPADNKFAFGAPSNDAPKPSFGAPSSNGAAPGSSNGFSFKFGETAKPSTPFGAPATPTAPSPSAFGFNTPTSTNAPSTLFGGGGNGSTTPAGTPTPFTFGATSNQQQ